MAIPDRARRRRNANARRSIGPAVILWTLSSLATLACIDLASPAYGQADPWVAYGRATGSAEASLAGYPAPRVF